MGVWCFRKASYLFPVSRDRKVVRAQVVTSQEKAFPRAERVLPRGIQSFSHPAAFTAGTGPSNLLGPAENTQADQADERPEPKKSCTGLLRPAAVFGIKRHLRPIGTGPGQRE